ncbi:MAG: glycosyltransferase family 9 protein [Alphaproteobacteria bacterium]
MTPKKILIFVGEDLLGDALLKMPFVYGVRDLFPKAEIHWWAGYGKTAFKEMLAPLVDGIFADTKEHAFADLDWKSLLKGSTFKEHSFDLIIDTQRDLKNTLLLRKIPHKKFISSTQHYVFSDYSPGRGRKPSSEHLSDKLLFLIEPIKGEKTEPQFAKVPEDYKTPFKEYFSAHKTYVGLAPGAGQTIKQWPLENFIEVARELVAKNKVPVFILGPQEASWKELLKDVLPEALFPLQEYPEWLKSPLYTAGMSSYFEKSVANDSGTGHLLALGGKPLISLFGKTKAAKVHPLAEHLTILKSLDHGTLDVKDIPVSDVLRAVC